MCIHCLQSVVRQCLSTLEVFFFLFALCFCFPSAKSCSQRYCKWMCFVCAWNEPIAIHWYFTRSLIIAPQFAFEMNLLCISKICLSVERMKSKWHLTSWWVRMTSCFCCGRINWFAFFSALNTKIWWQIINLYANRSIDANATQILLCLFPS